MRTTAVITIAALIGITACQGDDDVAPTLPTDPSTTTVSTTDDLAPTTSPVPTTTPTTPTTPLTTDPLIDEAAETQAVVDAFVHAWSELNLLKLDPTDDEQFDKVRSLYAGPLLIAIEEQIDNFRTLGYASRPNPDLPETIVPDESSVALFDGRARFQYCELDSNVLVEVGTGPNGTDALVDESVSISISTVELELRDNNWIAVSNDELRREDRSKCDD